MCHAFTFSNPFNDVCFMYVQSMKVSVHDRYLRMQVQVVMQIVFADVFCYHELNIPYSTVVVQQGTFSIVIYLFCHSRTPMEHLLTEVLRMRAVSLNHTTWPRFVSLTVTALLTWRTTWCSTVRDTQSEVYSSICVCLWTKDRPIPCSAVSIAQ